MTVTRAILCAVLICVVSIMVCGPPVFTRTVECSAVEATEAAAEPTPEPEQSPLVKQLSDLNAKAARVERKLVEGRP